MSHIGNNIRKIRSVKNQSQTEFAELFDLKRASVGAYEEGRAEPKIATVIQIANYFGISTDDLLQKDLSVNDLYRFDIFKEELQSEYGNTLTPSVKPVEVIDIPLVTTNNKSEYIKNGVKALPVISLPLAKGSRYLAFEVEDNSMLSRGSGVGSGDLVIACRPRGFGAERLEEGKLYLYETTSGYALRRLKTKSEKELEWEPLSSSYYAELLKVSEVKKLWQVCRVVSSFSTDFLAEASER